MANAGIAGSARVRSSQVMFTSMPNIYQTNTSRLLVQCWRSGLRMWRWSLGTGLQLDLHRVTLLCTGPAWPERLQIAIRSSASAPTPLNLRAHQPSSTVIQMHLSDASSVTFVSKLQKYSVIFVTTWSPQVSLISAFHNCFGLAGDSTPQDPAHADLFHMLPEEWRQATPSHIKPHVVFTNSPS